MESFHRTIGLEEAKIKETGARDDVNFTLVGKDGKTVKYYGHVTGVRAANNSIVDPEGTAVLYVEGIFHEDGVLWPKHFMVFVDYDTRDKKRASGHARIYKGRIKPVSHAHKANDTSGKSSQKRWRYKKPYRKGGGAH